MSVKFLLNRDINNYFTELLKSSCNGFRNRTSCRNIKRKCNYFINFKH